jgi:hypothetical protein
MTGIAEDGLEVGVSDWICTGGTGEEPEGEEPGGLEGWLMAYSQGTGSVTIQIRRSWRKS